MLLFFLAALATGFAGWRLWRRLRFFLHMAQLEGYRPSRLQHWLGDHPDLLVRPSHAVGLVVLGGAVFLMGVAPVRTVVIAALILWPLAFISSRRYRSTQEKKPLAFTARLQRLMGTAAGLGLLTIGGGAAAGGFMGAPEGYLALLAGLLLADLGAPLWVLAATVLNLPVERYVQEGFKRQARATIHDRPDLLVLGITGSYGKTSTKFIVAEILRQRFNVCATPSSYNTPMGLCIVINNKLRPEHQVLVLEMGMRYSGDIAELCTIAQPDLAIVTSVGPAHLETMGTVEAIADEKADIIRHARPGAPVVLNMDDERVAAMASEATGPLWRVSVTGHPEADITASNIAYGPEGTTFNVTDDTGATATFRTELLGQHNVLNILLGVAVGRQQGLRLRQIAHAVRRVAPVEHRLQLRQQGPITVIDDAFNSNPVGARNALEILGQFDTGRRVVVTPGMVELGERQTEENHALGRHMANHVDLAVLVGEEQTRPIREGLQAANFPEEAVHTFDTLFDAQAFLKTYTREGDVVLYENDLPDQYDV